MYVPDGLKETVERVHGERGRRWLATFPALLGECRRRWSLELERPFGNLSYNLVIPGRTAEGAQVVLKLGVPCPELFTEVAALGLFGGVGAARLLDHDVEAGALLIERAMPGDELHILQGEREAARTASALMRRLWRDAPDGHTFPSLAVWFRGFERFRARFEGGGGPLPSGLVARAERTFLELNASAERAVILHGDLHHMNILYSARDGWLAIDPKGICGDPGYEVGPYMLNKLPPGATDSALGEVLNRRLSIFSDELGMSRERLARWAFCHAVLSAVWSCEDSEDWGEAIRLARILERLR